MFSKTQLMCTQLPHIPSSSLCQPWSPHGRYDNLLTGHWSFPLEFPNPALHFGLRFALLAGVNHSLNKQKDMRMKCAQKDRVRSNTERSWSAARQAYECSSHAELYSGASNKRREK